MKNITNFVKLAEEIQDMLEEIQAATLMRESLKQNGSLRYVATINAVENYDRVIINNKQNKKDRDQR